MSALRNGTHRRVKLSKSVNSSADLHMEVALANTPEELRDELRQR